MSRVVSFRFTLASLGLAAVMVAPARATPLLDDFNTDTSANYTGSNSYGSGGSFTIDASDNNVLRNLPASGNTYSVVHTTSSLGIGETYSIDALDPWSGGGLSGGGDGQFIMLTTSTGQPNGSSSYGFRLRVDNNSVIRLFTASSAGNSTVNTTTSPSVAPDTFWIDRTTATDFEFYYGPSLGSRTLITTGSLAASDVVSPLHVGIQSWSTGGSEQYDFDNLQIQNIPEPSAFALTAIGVLALVGLRRRKR